MFESVPHAQLEIHTGMMASAILSDTIPCERLYIEQEIASEEVSLVDASEQDDLEFQQNKATHEALAATAVE